MALALTVGLSAPVAAQTTIGATGGASISAWGLPTFRNFGQTITAPTDNVLNSFSFWLGAATSGTANLGFQAHVYRWSVALSHATGSALFTSASSTLTATTTTPFTQFTFNTGGIPLTTGDVYALFLSTQLGSGTVKWEFGGEVDQYSGGHMIFNASDDSEAGWTTTTWGGFSGTSKDLRFEAQFSSSGAVVPEPSTWLLLGTGLLGLGIAARRRGREDEPVLEEPR